jgi:hypothetical protein
MFLSAAFGREAGDAPGAEFGPKFKSIRSPLQSRRRADRMASNWRRGARHCAESRGNIGATIGASIPQ